jgi:KipI family sensor histidine kinase inhibitor
MHWRSERARRIMTAHSPAQFPALTYIGIDGVLVRFGDTVSAASNDAALAFHNHMKDADIEGVLETAPSLTAVYLRVDIESDVESIVQSIDAQMQSRDWFSVTSEPQRRWTIPCCFDGRQLAEAAALAGVSEEVAVNELTEAQVRVLTIGFAPGQPYLGNLPDHWDLPRMGGIAPNVPACALVVAVRQLIIFANAAPTGWRHIGTTGFHDFQRERAEPFAFRAGDLVRFTKVGRGEMDTLIQSDDGLGGAICEALT